MANPFFRNYGPFRLSEIIKVLNITNNSPFQDNEIHDIKDLASSSINDLTFSGT